MRRVLKMSEEEIQENIDGLAKDKKLGLTPTDDF
jgi:hypothetical protein